MPSRAADTAIDIVYLWVDGSDPVWRAKRHAAALCLGAAESQMLAPFGNVEGRFRDNGELRYSLRALERFFPGHGQVYLVTDGQTPPWLRSTSRLTVVSHQDLLPANRLPTFDSGNIESYIHRIPGLSERYFYLNDDVFFGAPVRLDHWFWPGGFYAAWSDDPAVAKDPMRPEDNSLPPHASHLCPLAAADAEVALVSARRRCARAVCASANRRVPHLEQPDTGVRFRAALGAGPWDGQDPRL